MRGIGVVSLLISLCCQADFQTLPTDFHCQGNFLQQKIANGDLRLKMRMEIVPFFRCLSQLLRQAKSLEPKQWQRKAQGYTLGFFFSLMAFQVSFHRLFSKLQKQLSILLTFYFSFCFFSDYFLPVPTQSKSFFKLSILSSIHPSNLQCKSQSQCTFF